MSDDRALAQAVAEIAALRGDLDAAHEMMFAVEKERDTLKAQLAAAGQGQAAHVAQLEAELGELRRLLADPRPDETGVALARVYLTGDGLMHKLYPDAQRHAAKLHIASRLGVSAQVAGALVDRAADVLNTLAPIAGQARG